MKINTLFCFFLTLGMATLFSSCNETNTEPYDTSSEKNLYNVSYGSSNQQVFDLYLPANRTTNTKTLILVHGGGWTAGDKADMNYVTNIIKQYLPGYAIANINYRLATVGNPAFPMQIDDLAAVVAKLKSTDEYVISDNFGFIGVSAGAHLSMLYGYAYDENSNVKMVASIVGPTDFTDVNYLNNPTLAPMFEMATGVSYASNPAYYRQLSPLSRATSSSPPTILFYGNQDPLIPTTQGVNLHNRLNQLSVYNEFNLYNGGHGDWVIADQLDAYGKLVAFVQNKF